MTNATNIGAERYGGKRRHGLAWVPWTALLMLLLTLALIYLLLQNVTDENDKAGVDLTDDEIAKTAPNADGGSSAPAIPNNNMASPSGTTGSASVGAITTANGTDIVSLASAGRFTTVNGNAFTATNATVTSVVANEGFWVGNASSQVFVYLSPQARGTGESAYQVSAGQHVDFAGVVKPAPSDPSTLGVTATEGADLLRSQGAYLEATTLRIR